MFAGISFSNGGAEPYLSRLHHGGELLRRLALFGWEEVMGGIRSAAQYPRGQRLRRQASNFQKSSNIRTKPAPKENGHRAYLSGSYSVYDNVQLNGDDLLRDPLACPSGARRSPLPRYPHGPPNSAVMHRPCTSGTQIYTDAAAA